jgi:hypothetical protein
MGPSDTTNTGGICLPDHQLKTNGLTHITNSTADGSCDWITAWGTRIHLPPRPFLHDPADHPPGHPADHLLDHPPDDPPHTPPDQPPNLDHETPPGSGPDLGRQPWDPPPF